jgi:signal transduction histidine kinase
MILRLNKGVAALFRQSVALLVLLFLLVFTYAFFFEVPYAGFAFSQGRVVEVYVTPVAGAELQVGDQLLEIGSVTWSDFARDRRQTLFDGARPGDLVPLVIQRDEEILTLSWSFPGFDRRSFLDRLNSGWWLPYVFWLFGAAIFLFIRPRDTSWQLLVGFNFLTAIWLSVGSGPSSWHVWNSAFLLPVAIWVSLPVYWHLHWIFPRPLADLSPGFIQAVYITAIALAALELFQVLPFNLHLFGFMGALGGSLILLLVHAIRQPTERHQVRLLVSVVATVLIPIIGSIVAGMYGTDLRFASLVLLALPVIPGSYLYTIYRYRLGRLELRANRLIASYLYLILIGSAALVIAAVSAYLFDLSGNYRTLPMISAVAVGLITILGFSGFQRFVEQHILGIPVPPASLLESYATQIATKLDMASLANLLKHQVLASLLVRQSAIVYWEENRSSLSVLFTLSVDKDALPLPQDIPALLVESGVYRSPDVASQLCPWVRLVLPLCLGDKTMGLWLLGRRDPDDMYTQIERPMLRALAAQTAITLTNILQAENLHKLYQANIDHHERERNHLALELHDEVLNQVALLGMYVDRQSVAPQFYDVFDTLTVRFRQVISGLRPAMLNYGLRAALDELIDSLAERVGDSVSLLFEVQPSDLRYPISVEEHLFRIVQQATENALEHASAKTIRIYGHLATEQISLVVEDDGMGFPAGKQLDLSSLLMHKHFGLAGMFERASLIGAEVEINSVEGQSTQVCIRWHLDKENN